MYLIVFLCSCLLILSFLSILAKQLPELQASVLSYGKLNLHNDKKPKTLWATYLAKLIVPKHYFSHFYVIGLLFALICIVELISFDVCQQPLLLIFLLQHYDTDQGTHHLSKSTCTFGLALLTLHLARRVYESFWIERPSKTATMHISHYLIGVGFYGAMVFGTWLEGLASFGRSNSQQQNQEGTHITATILAITLFLYASYHQYNCHVILASLRKDKKEGGYTIPRGDWFEWIVAPHYFADILVYLSLNILYQFQNYILVCGLVWTIINLSIVANETQAWYHLHFSTEKYNLSFPNGRWRIIPGCF
jgi:3-oxo-5-alpha-steroid 4-dehydrogenase 3